MNNENVADELSLTFKNIKDRFNGFATDVQERIRVNQQTTAVNNDYLAGIREAVDSNQRRMQEAEKQLSDIKFIDNHLKENPKSATTVKQAMSVSTSNKNPQKVPKVEPVKDENGEIVRYLNKAKVRGLTEKLKERVFGQDEGIKVVVDVLNTAALELKINDKKPDGCYFFAGPTGVGKTELATGVSEILNMPIMVINCGEYGASHEVSKLIGAPPGYAGCDEEGMLTAYVKENPACVVLLDEVEKADNSINKILLSIMDKGMCADNKGNPVYFSQVILIATSNVGSEVEYISDEEFLKNTAELELFSIEHRKEFNSKATDKEVEVLYIQNKKNELRMEFIKEQLSPEIINRYDAIIHLKSLNVEIYKKISKKFLNILTERVKKKHKFDLSYTEKLIDWMAEKSYDPAMGGRPARRFIEQILTEPLKTYMLTENFEQEIENHKSILIDLNKKLNVCFKGTKGKVLGVLEDTEKQVAQLKASKFSSMKM